MQQAEDNVVERLFQAGLLDAPSEFDKTLEALANNILVYNNIQTSRPIRVRTLLTEPLESLAVGNTIIISKSLIDTTSVSHQTARKQIQGNLNAHPGLPGRAHHPRPSPGHQVRLQRSPALPLHLGLRAHPHAPHRRGQRRSGQEGDRTAQREGARRRVSSTSASTCSSCRRALKGLPALNQPMIGDALIKSDTDRTFWMQALVPKGIKLDMKDLKQQAAMPLASFLRFDPWTDQLVQMHPSFEPILSERDKMPFEVEPVYLKLAYYKAPAAAPAAPAAADATPSAPAAPAADTTAPTAAAPAPAVDPAAPQTQAAVAPAQ